METAIDFETSVKFSPAPLITNIPDCAEHSRGNNTKFHQLVSCEYQIICWFCVNCFTYPFIKHKYSNNNIYCNHTVIIVTRSISYTKIPPIGENDHGDLILMKLTHNPWLWIRGMLLTEREIYGCSNPKWMSSNPLWL